MKSIKQNECKIENKNKTNHLKDIPCSGWKLCKARSQKILEANQYTDPLLKKFLSVKVITHAQTKTCSTTSQCVSDQLELFL